MCRRDIETKDKLFTLYLLLTFNLQYYLLMKYHFFRLRDFPVMAGVTVPTSCVWDP